MVDDCMSIELHPKLEGFPQIRYLNLDARTDRNEWMVNQFEKYGITDYVRISADRYGPHNYDEWKKRLIVADYGKYIRKDNICYVSILVNQMQSIIDWYNENSSETCIIAEDDLNMDTLKLWPFDWEYFMSKLPCNWDCVQLHVIGGSYVPMGLTKRTKNNHGATAYLINRRYAEKLIKMHYIDEKFTFYMNYGYNKQWPEYHYQSPDFVPYEIGVTYTFPLFITNSTLISDCEEYSGKINLMVKRSDLETLKWWKEDSSAYTLTDLFSLNTLKRKRLIVRVYYKDTELSTNYLDAHGGE